ncbi:hypothetical protein [Arthrobacter sp. StoSoilB20]|uniref:hypothetical protein n=1 Tax=Arthrobacter sp. StoSoilB20 TaxID=2830995 RepID=UPI001CC44C5A|nr:hypothetical protein [Arthrobacter sp. StoSoilB20]BCW57556.1 hypothetical protein StoSoilB20_09030 [Arthrobacter sp. StoSoilB20]
MLNIAQRKALLAAPQYGTGKVTSAPAGPSGVDGVFLRDGVCLRDSVCLRAGGISAGFWAMPGTTIPTPLSRTTAKARLFIPAW